MNRQHFSASVYRADSSEGTLWIHGQRTTDKGQRTMHLIFDAHLDLAWNAIDWNRDLRLPVADIRRREREQCMTGKGRGEGTVSFVELRRGQVGLFIATLL